MNSQTQLPLQCKVCDRGILVRKKVFRMSGPVVAIGYILLIPSILGMIGCALVSFKLFTYNPVRSPVFSKLSASLPETQDTSFRRRCINGMMLYNQNHPDQVFTATAIAEVCECSLAMFKETYAYPVASTKNAELSAISSCTEKYVNGTLVVPSDDIQQFYAAVIRGSEKQAPESNSTPEPEANSTPNFVSILGGGFTLALGIAFFVSGLLGWLLIMKKRVLQCSVCGAVINAS